MSVFASKPRDKQRHAGPPAVSAGTITVIAPGTTLTGNLEAEGVLQVEGRVNGTITSRSRVYVTGAGEVVGDIHAQEIVVAGTVRGDIAAAERAELQPGGTLHGDVTAPRVAVLEGGTLNGRLTMKAVAEAAKKRHAA